MSCNSFVCCCNCNYCFCCLPILQRNARARLITLICCSCFFLLLQHAYATSLQFMYCFCALSMYICMGVCVFFFGGGGFSSAYYIPKRVCSPRGNWGYTNFTIGNMTFLLFFQCFDDLSQSHQNVAAMVVACITDRCDWFP